MRRIFSHTTILRCLLGLIIIIHFANLTHYGAPLITTEPFSSIYDALGESLAKGSVEIPPEDLGTEAFIYNGKTITYFAPFPAILRLALNGIWPGHRGDWGNVSSLCAVTLSLVVIYLAIVGQSQKNSSLSTRDRFLLNALFLTGAGLSSPLFFLTSTGAIYHEAILWGLAFSLAGICCLLLMKESYLLYLVFSCCAGLALLSRVTFAPPLFLCAGFLIAQILWSTPTDGRSRLTSVLTLTVPAFCALSFSLWYNEARFNNPVVFLDMSGHGNGTAPPFTVDRALRHLWYYLLPLNKDFFLHFPRITIHRLPIDSTNRFIDAILPLAAFAPWMLLTGLWGCRYARRDDTVISVALLGGAIQCLFLTSFYFVANRYQAEFMPLLMLGGVVFLKHARVTSGLRSLALTTSLALLITLGSAVNVAATLDWAGRNSFYLSELERSRVAAIIGSLKEIVRHR